MPVDVTKEAADSIREVDVTKRTQDTDINTAAEAVVASVQIDNNTQEVPSAQNVPSAIIIPTAAQKSNKPTFRIDPNLISGAKPTLNVSCNVTTLPQTETTESNHKPPDPTLIPSNTIIQETLADLLPQEAQAIDQVDKKPIPRLEGNDLFIRRDSDNSIGYTDRKPLLSFEKPVNSTHPVKDALPKQETKCVAIQDIPGTHVHEEKPAQYVNVNQPLSSSSSANPLHKNMVNLHQHLSEIISTMDKHEKELNQKNHKVKSQDKVIHGSSFEQSKVSHQNIRTAPATEPSKVSHQNIRTAPSFEQPNIPHQIIKIGPSTELPSILHQIIRPSSSMEQPTNSHQNIRTGQYIEQPNIPHQNIKTGSSIEQPNIIHQIMHLPTSEKVDNEQISVSNAIKRFNDHCETSQKREGRVGTVYHSGQAGRDAARPAYATMDCRSKRSQLMTRGYTVSEYSVRADTFRRQASVGASAPTPTAPHGPRHAHCTHCKTRSKSQGSGEDDIFKKDHVHAEYRSTVSTYRVRFDESSLKSCDQSSHRRHRPASAASAEPDEDFFEKYETLV